MEALNAMAPTVPRGKIDPDTWEQIEPDPPEWVRFDERRGQLKRNTVTACGIISACVTALTETRGTADCREISTATRRVRSRRGTLPRAAA